MIRFARLAAPRFPRVASFKPRRRGVSTVAPDASKPASLWPYWANRADRLHPNNLVKQKQNARRQSTRVGMPAEEVGLLKAAEDRGDTLFAGDDAFVWKSTDSFVSCHTRSAAMT